MILGGVADPDTLDRLSRLCGEIRLRTHSRSWYDDGRRGRTVTYEPFRVLPPELLRGLPEWRTLVIRGNLSPVVVRLRTAWRRLDYRHAHHMNGSPRPWTVTEVGRPERDWPEVDTAEALIPLPPDDASWHSGEPGWEPEGSGELAAHPRAHRAPRPRRPWEPPTDPGGPE